MDRSTRKLFFSAHIREALSHENPFLRHVSFALESEAPAMGPGTTVSIDEGEAGDGMIVLSASSSDLQESQEAKLRSHGFEETEDTVLFGRTVFSREVPSGTPYNDLVTFVEWAFISIIGAPFDYTPELAEKAGESKGGGCASGCQRAARWIVILMAIVFVTAVAISVIGGK